VPESRRYIGFDAFEQATSHLSAGDVVIMATPPAFRWVHFGHAIKKGLNVFMEKPVAVDGAASRRMFKLAKKSQEKKLKVGVGLMCRHCDARRELFDKIQDGAIGDITTLRAYRLAGPTGSAAALRRPEGMSELMYQIKNFHAFLWASGGAFSDFLIHNIDECCWMKNAWPVQAEGAGGRHYREDSVDQNFDNYSVEYTFDDGTKMFLGGRTMPGCFGQFASYAHGTEGSAIISTAAHSPAKSRIYWGQKFDKQQLAWSFAKPETSPYQLEWDHLIQAIRQDEEYNEAERGIEASLVTAMGRLAAHTGQKVTREEALGHNPELAPNVDKLTLEGPAPVQADEDGKYPVPLPGLVSDREY
jgi:predicted dehydrogenase